MNYGSQKFLTIIVGTLLLIPLIFMMPGVNDSLPNRVGVIMGIGQLAIFCAAASTFKPWELGTFLCGMVLILAGIAFYVLVGGFDETARLAHAAGRLSAKEVRFWTDGIELWKYTVPVISMCIGINIVSSFISATPPDEEHSRLG